MKRTSSPLLLHVLLLSIAATLFTDCRAQKADKTPRIVNFVNFVRDIEPRVEGDTRTMLFETTRNEAEALRQYNFRGTWLLQYDALIDPLYQPLMREEMARGCEVGGWWEITQPHVEAAGLRWRGRFPWDWHADKGFSVGYTQQERELLVDVYMQKFRDVFGQLPQSIGSWFIDAHSLAYMREKYGIESCCICKDQIGTDGYTLWGGYWAGAYYPSRVNAYMPAQSRSGQIDLPVFRMLGSDPLYQYIAGVGGSTQHVVTIEPVYVNAQKPDWVAWYLRCQTEHPALGFTYFQAGQENSFMWGPIKPGYDAQLPQIAQLQRQGKLRVETLIESARAFRRKYSVTPPTACSALEDYTDRQGKTVWFNSRFYRANILWEAGRMSFRDIHLFDERVVSPYYDRVCTSNKCDYLTQPIVDGNLWSTAKDMAGLRFFEQLPDGSLCVLQGFSPLITTGRGTMHIVWPLSDGRGEIRLSLDEKRMRISCTAKDLNWCLALRTQPQATLPFQTIGQNLLTAEQEGYTYRLPLKRGTFQDLRKKGDGAVFLIQPEKGRVEMECAGSCTHAEAWSQRN